MSTPSRRTWHCTNPDCGAALGTVRPASLGGVYLDAADALAAARRMDPHRFGEWVLTCWCGSETAWRGKEVKWREQMAS